MNELEITTWSDFTGAFKVTKEAHLLKIIENAAEGLNLGTLEKKFEHCAVSTKGLFCSEVFQEKITCSSSDLPIVKTMEPYKFYFLHLGEESAVAWLADDKRLILWKCDSQSSTGVFQITIEFRARTKLVGEFRLLNDNPPVLLINRVMEWTCVDLWEGSMLNSQVHVSQLPLDNDNSVLYTVSEENFLAADSSSSWYFIQSDSHFGLLKIAGPGGLQIPLFSGLEDLNKNQLEQDSLSRSCRRCPKTGSLTWDGICPYPISKYHMKTFCSRIKRNRSFRRMVECFDFFREHYGLDKESILGKDFLHIRCASCSSSLSQSFRFFKGGLGLNIVLITKEDAQKMTVRKSQYRLDGQRYNIFHYVENEISDLYCECGAFFCSSLNDTVSILCPDYVFDQLCPNVLNVPGILEVENLITLCFWKYERMCNDHCLLHFISLRQNVKDMTCHIALQRLASIPFDRLCEADSKHLARSLRKCKELIDSWLDHSIEVNRGYDGFISKGLIISLVAINPSLVDSKFDPFLRSSKYQYETALFKISSERLKLSQEYSEKFSPGRYDEEKSLTRFWNGSEFIDGVVLYNAAPRTSRCLASLLEQQ